MTLTTLSDCLDGMPAYMALKEKLRPSSSQVACEEALADLLLKKAELETLQDAAKMQKAKIQQLHKGLE